jgi:hypothetical protein
VRERQHSRNFGQMFTLQSSSTLQQHSLAGPGAQIVLRPSCLAPATLIVSVSPSRELLLAVDPPSTRGVVVNGKEVVSFPSTLVTSDVLELRRLPGSSSPEMYLITGVAPAAPSPPPPPAVSLSSQLSAASVVFAPMQRLMNDLCLKIASLGMTVAGLHVEKHRPMPSSHLPPQLLLTHSAEWAFDALDHIEKAVPRKAQSLSVGCQVPLDADRHLVGAEFALAARSDASVSLLRAENLKLREIISKQSSVAASVSPDRSSSSTADLLLEIDALRAKLDRKNASIEALLADVWHKDRQIEQLTYGMPLDVMQALRALDFERRRYAELVRLRRLESQPTSTPPAASASSSAAPVLASPPAALRSSRKPHHLQEDFGRMVKATAAESAKITSARPSAPEAESAGAALGHTNILDDEERAVDAFVTVQLALRDALMAGSHR